MDEVACRGCRALHRRVAELEAQVEQLTRLLALQQRAGKRQAAPFAKGPPASQPKKPGRKPGAAYGTRAHRPPPALAQITETYEAPLPAACPGCGGRRLGPGRRLVQLRPLGLQGAKCVTSQLPTEGAMLKGRKQLV